MNKFVIIFKGKNMLHNKISKYKDVQNADKD